MTQAEKIEELRKDVLRLADAMTSTNCNITALSIHLENAARSLKKVEEGVAALQEALEQQAARPLHPARPR